jgi:hypothetical protein
VLRVSSFEPRRKAQEFGLWHPLDSWLIPHLEPLAGSAPGIDCVSMRAARRWRGKGNAGTLKPKRCRTRLLDAYRPPLFDLLIVSKRVREYIILDAPKQSLSQNLLHRDIQLAVGWSQST